MPFRVNSKLCQSCIFGPNSPISPERFEDLKQQWQSKDIVQECHDGTVNNDHIGCRGHYEAARRGELPTHPLDAIRDQMGLTIDRPSFMTVAERMGWVVFEKVGKREKSMTLDEFVKELKTCNAMYEVQGVIMEFERTNERPEHPHQFTVMFVTEVSDTRYNVDIPNMAEIAQEIAQSVQGNYDLQTEVNSHVDQCAEANLDQLPDED